MKARVFAGEILQVVSNFIINAMDAVPETGGVLSLRVRKYKGKIHLSVMDNGHGVTPAMSKVLFQLTKQRRVTAMVWDCGYPKASRKSTAEQSRTDAKLGDTTQKSGEFSFCVQAKQGRRNRHPN